MEMKSVTWSEGGGFGTDWQMLFVLTLKALTDTIFRYALNLCLFGHLYSQNFHMMFLFLTIIVPGTILTIIAAGTASHETLTWPGIALFLPDFSSMTLPFLTLYPKSPASADRICFSVVNSFIPSLPEVAAVPHPHCLQDPQLPTASSESQQGTQALSNSAGEPPLRWDEQMGSLRCPRCGGGGFCPEATPAINSQSVGTTSDPQYGGFVDADFKN